MLKTLLYSNFEKGQHEKPKRVCSANDVRERRPDLDQRTWDIIAQISGESHERHYLAGIMIGSIPRFAAPAIAKKVSFVFVLCVQRPVESKIIAIGLHANHLSRRTPYLLQWSAE
jgi:hypothetical protein